ncbi:MAG: stage II sporulation protein M [Deltaproteobacteria bacterium]|nr:stage II sporulation protein M [Deltaproteobacteria bacterium]
MTELLRLKARQSKLHLETAVKEYRGAIETASKDSFDKLYRLITSFELLTAHLYTLRKVLDKNDILRRQIEEYTADVSYDIVRFQKEDREMRPDRMWLTHYRKVWRENIGLFIITAVVFVMSLIIGASVSINHPDYVASILAVDTIENVLEKHKWFEGIQNNPFLSGAEIALNNIMVCLNCALSGILLGVGSVLVLIYNGLFIGALYGFCMVNGFDAELLNFVTSHGPIELTIIVASAFAGFLFGRGFFTRPFKNFKSTFAICAKDAGVVLLGVLPWLLIAACLEAFISPWPFIPFGVKMFLSLAAFVAFWMWTFKPSFDRRSTSSQPG